MTRHPNVSGAAKRSGPDTVRQAAQSLWARLTREKDIRHIITNSLMQIFTMGITSGLGFVFWWWAARAYPTANVGFAASSIAVMNILTVIGLTGIGTYLMGNLYRAGAATERLITNGLVFIGVYAFLEAALCAMLGYLFVPAWGFMGATPLTMFLFATGVSLSVVSTAFDMAMLGLQRGWIQLVRNSCFTSGKLLLVIIASHSALVMTPWTLYAIWTLANGVSLVVSLPFLGRHLAWRRCRLHLGTLRQMVRPALGHYLLSLIVGAPSQLIPVLVAATVAKETNAYFYTSWLIVSFFYTIPYSVVNSLYAVGADHPAALARKVRFTLRTSALLGVLSVAVLVPAAPLLLRLFGTAYAEHATPYIIVLILAVFGFAARDHAIVIGRLQQRVGFTMGIMVLCSISELGGAVLGVTLAGAVGMCIGWVGALTCEAMALSPILVRAMRLPSPIIEPVAPSRHAAVLLPLSTLPMTESMPMPQITQAMLKRYLADAAAADSSIRATTEPRNGPHPPSPLPHAPQSPEARHDYVGSARE